MDIGLLAKWVHILSSTLLFGTGIGTAFFFVSAIRTRDPLFIAKDRKNRCSRRLPVHAHLRDRAARHRIVSGAFTMATRSRDAWLFWTLVLYAIALCCWLPVVWLQIRLTKMATEAAAANQPLPRGFLQVFLVVVRPWAGLPLWALWSCSG